MKYKVIIDLTSTTAAGDSVSFTFYTKAQAISCAQSFLEIVTNAVCFVWDGSSWTQYNN